MFSNRKKLKIQGKTSAHRKALMKSLVIELIRAKKIKTTPIKAKALKSTFDQLVTKAKKDSDHSRRQVVSFFGNNERAVERLYQVIGENLSDRTSGYTRVIHTLPRKGDNAKQVYVMLVNTEAQEQKSKIKQVLEKQEVQKEEKQKKGIRGTMSKIAKAPTKSGKDSTAKTRRNSM